MKILKAIISVSFLLLLGRISGFFREWLIADRVGADFFSDFAMVLITLPDLMVSLIIGGGFAAAVIPEFKSLKENDAQRLFLQLCFIIGGFFSLIALVLSFFGVTFIYLLAPGIPEEFVKNNIILFTITSIAIPLTALSGVLKARMDTYNLFFYGAVGTLIFNTSIICMILLPLPLSFIESISIGVLSGAFLRLMLQLIGITKIPQSNIKSSYNGINKHLIFKIFSAISFSAVLVLLPIIARSIASINYEGALSLFTYAFRINELPMALIVGSIATVLLPTLSSLYEEKSIEGVRQLIITSLRASLLVCISISIPIIFYASEVVELIFFSTNLTALDINSISKMIIVSFIFLPFRALLILLFPILSSINAFKGFGLLSFIILGTLIISSTILSNIYGLVGSMIAYGISNLVGSICLCVILFKKIGVSIFREVFSRFTLCFLVPMLISISINYIGVNYFYGTISIIFFGIFSTLIFIFISLFNDRHIKISYIVSKFMN